MSLFGRPLSDGDCLDVAGSVVRLKVHSRARRVSLRLDRTRREVIATAPSPRRLAEAAAFARDRADWIAQRMAELEARMAEGERRMEEEKKKLAEERLVILENQARILC